MKTSIYLFKRCKGSNKKNFFLREITSTCDFLYLEQIYRTNKDFNYGLEISIDFFNNISTVYVNKDFTFQSQITDWTDGVTRYVGQYISRDCPVIMEYHSCDRMVHLFYNKLYTDLNKFVSDFQNEDNTNSHLEESLADAFDLLNKSKSKSEANEN